MPPTESADETPSSHVIRILIIDDDNINAMLARSVLERNGCTVQIMTNPVKALEKYVREKEAIDLLLVDYFMPTLDGGATIEHLRKLNPDVKVLLFSGADEMHVRQIIRKHSIEGYVHKPLRKEEALQTIRQILFVPSENVARI